MSQIAVLLWLGLASARPALEPDLSRFATHRDLTFRPPRERPPSPFEPYDPALVQRLERDLEHARIAATSLEETRALEELHKVSGALRAHPELPQCAWLMAEALALEIEIRSRQGTDTTDLERQRRLLEGARATRYSAEASASPTELATEPRPIESLKLTGLADRDRIEWNGGELPTRSPTVGVGVHHVRVLRAGRAVWAGWVSVTPGHRAVALPAPPLEACSQDDFEGVRFEANGIAASGVRCALWVAAREAGAGVELALCRGSACERPVRWPPVRRQPARRLAPASGPEQGSTWPYFVVGGTLAAAVTGLVLWQVGAFEDDEETRARWVFGGVNPTGVRVAGTF